ncbi:MAG: type III pantothenate kinase [candidate division NC10 bacterium]|nr:type III pantothenate kinase [candidate division NC10 bacterium]
MLLAMDVGNTNIVLGLFTGKTLLHHWRIATRREGTVDEYRILIQELFSLHGLQVKAVESAVISSVVPPLQVILEEMIEAYLGIKPLLIGPGVKTGMPILYDNPREVGADRIVNAVAAMERYGKPAIVVDFGTATTFDVISERGEYVGGAIVPGIQISAEALFQHTAKLPRIEITRPKTVIGKNTVASMQSGLYYGYLSLVEGMLARIKAEMNTHPVVVATGGLAHLIVGGCPLIDHIDPLLTLEGLRILYERNIP